jgi:hypothetical protein
LAVSCLAQGAPEKQDDLSAKATRLSRALAALKAAPDDRISQRRYLDAFPRTYKEYLLLFDYRQPLYDGHEYVVAISSLAGNYETEVGSLLVNLSKDAHYDSDAPAYLQNATSIYAAEHTKTFAELLDKLPADRQANLISFLADVENHDSYPEYQALIDHLKAMGKTSLASKFETARTRRKKQPHD